MKKSLLLTAAALSLSLSLEAVVKLDVIYDADENAFVERDFVKTDINFYDINYEKEHRERENVYLVFQNKQDVLTQTQSAELVENRKYKVTFFPRNSSQTTTTGWMCSPHPIKITPQTKAVKITIQKNVPATKACNVEIIEK
ncbi:hypothetical protein Bealeia1_01039 [Candidatus Bealeia paramacronuclearis]|uniref:Uncharacterized protein n=1 Tax=Candidatus Bealeia paramacronuclearis TaxID=1921001 RepID=A0ABZ2C370_9PROT|nr:hypothetical protein [Candidatus Bealeia paramacronuclearis]